MKVEKWSLALLLLSAVLTTGCGQSDTKPATSDKSTDDHAHETASAKGDEHDHSGWWCAEHGVPEEVCSMCSAKVADGFQKKGDWCAEHDRAKSQCFHCDPTLKETFAAQYRAKYGEEPPPTEEDKAGKSANES